MRIFIDTNVIIAAFISRGTCAEVFEYCINEHSVFISEWVIDEVYNNLIGKLNLSEESVDSIIDYLKCNTVIIPNPPVTAKISRDSDDDNILAATLVCKADCLITGDQDLLIIKNHKKIPVISPSNFWQFEKEYRS